MILIAHGRSYPADWKVGLNEKPLAWAALKVGRHGNRPEAARHGAAAEYSGLLR
jgi:hypothetical protein